MSTSSYGIRTSVFGSPAWFFAECVAFGYPMYNPSPSKVRRTARWFYHYVGTLPCIFCRRHGRKFLKKIKYWKNVGVLFANRHNFCFFVYFFHSKVNERLQKPNISWEEFSKTFEPFHTNKYSCIISVSTEGSEHKMKCLEEETQGKEEGPDMDPAVWGCCCWFVLACVARDYPVAPSRDNKHTYWQLIMDLAHVLPHRESRHNVRQYMQRFDKTQRNAIMSSRSSFSAFVCEFHNYFNRLLNKPTMTIETFIRTYDFYRSKCKKTSNENDTCIEDESASDKPLFSSLCVQRKNLTTD